MKKEWGELEMRKKLTVTIVIRGYNFFSLFDFRASQVYIPHSKLIPLA